MLDEFLAPEGWPSYTAVFAKPHRGSTMPMFSFTTVKNMKRRSGQRMSPNSEAEHTQTLRRQVLEFIWIMLVLS